MSLGNVSVAILGCQALTYSQRIRNAAAKQKVSQWFSDQKGGYEGWPEDEPVGKNSQDRSPYHSISVTQTQSQDRQVSLPLLLQGWLTSGETGPSAPFSVLLLSSPGS